jgi:hypothetical protein
MTEEADLSHPAISCETTLPFFEHQDRRIVKKNNFKISKKPVL